MDLPPDDLNDVWQALANPWRRRILDVLRQGPHTTGQLTDAVGTSRHVLVQHLQVLRRAELVVTERQGRSRINHLNPIPIQQIYQRWVSTYEANWAEALVGLKRTVESTTERDETGGSHVG